MLFQLCLQSTKSAVVSVQALFIAPQGVLMYDCVQEESFSQPLCSCCYVRSLACSCWNSPTHPDQRKNKMSAGILCGRFQGGFLLCLFKDCIDDL